MARPDRAHPGHLADVAGLRVGHHQRTGQGWLTGTTVVHAPAGAVAAVDVRGGGPGTRETDALAPGNLVDRVHAVCLTGGSAYGLAAADGVMAELEHLGLGVKVGPDPTHVVPVVPTAVIFDLGRGGEFTNRPSAEFGRRALRSAKNPRAVSRAARGAIGAGTGARAGGLQGGLGMASIVVDLGERFATVAALAVVNASGSPFDPTTGALWVAHPAARRPNAADRRRLADALDEIRARALPLNTTIGVVATDATLRRSEAGRLALAAHDGLARAVRPAHGLTDGDTIFGLSTEIVDLAIDHDGLVRSPGSRVVQLNALCAAAADVFALACADATFSSRRIGEAPAYVDLCPSAVRQ